MFSPRFGSFRSKPTRKIAGEMRTVTVEKAVGLLNVELREEDKVVFFSKVQKSSPLYGRVWPGEVLHGCSADEAQASNKLGLEDYVSLFSSLTKFTLTIETPAEMEGAESIRFFRRDLTTPIGISYGKDDRSTYPRLQDHIQVADKFRSIASQLSGSDRMNVGDLVVGVCYKAAHT